jgi:thiol-disulfide isomerase/thioredoxin
MRAIGLTMLLVAMVAAATAAAEWPTVAAATAVPDVTLQAADGAAVRLSTFNGKVLLVDFWASWCVPCKTSFPALDAIYREYAPKGLEVVAVNLDEQRKNADAFLAAHPHRMTVLFDPKGIAPEAFAVKGMPSSYLIDRSGAIRFTHMGYSGNVDVSYRKEIAQLLAEP